MKAGLFLLFAIVLLPSALAQTSIERTLLSAQKKWNKLTDKGLPALSDLELATAIGHAEEAFIRAEWDWLAAHYSQTQSGRKLNCVGLLALAGDPASLPYEVPNFYRELITRSHLQPALELLRTLHAAVSAGREVLKSRFSEDPQRLRRNLLIFHEERRDYSAEIIDALLGIERSLAEFSLLQPGEYGDHTVYPWNRMTDLAQSFYNRAREFYKLARPKNGDVVWDLGCGHGRILLYGAALFPEVSFKGVDVVTARVAAMQRAADRSHLKNVVGHVASVLDIDFSDGHHFYFFNPFPALMPQVLSRVEQVAKRHPVSVYGHGVIEVREMLQKGQGWLFPEGTSSIFGRSR